MKKLQQPPEQQPQRSMHPPEHQPQRSKHPPESSEQPPQALTQVLRLPIQLQLQLQDPTMPKSLRPGQLQEPSPLRLAMLVRPLLEPPLELLEPLLELLES